MAYILLGLHLSSRADVPGYGTAALRVAVLRYFRLFNHNNGAWKAPIETS